MKKKCPQNVLILRYAINGFYACCLLHLKRSEILWNRAWTNDQALDKSLTQIAGECNNDFNLNIFSTF